MPGSSLDDRAVRLFAWRRKIGELRPFPAVVQEAMAALEDERCNARDIAGILSRDEAIAAAVLRRVNSAFLGVRWKASTLSQAVTLLGFEQVRTLLVAMGLFGQSRLQDPVAESNRRAVGRHSTTCARWAVELAVTTGYRSLEEASLAGLLHDIGKAVIGVSSPKEFVASVAMAQAEGVASCEVEERLLGVNHLDIGQIVAEHWRFPPAIRHAVELHHSPWPLPADESADIPRLKQLVAIVQVANRASQQSLAEQPPAGDDQVTRIAIGAEELLQRTRETEALLAG